MSVCFTPLIGCLFRHRPCVVRETPPENFAILEGNQPSLQKFCKSVVSLLSSRISQCCLSILLWKIAQFIRVQLLNLGIAQSWEAVTCSSHKLYNPSRTTNSTQPRNCTNPSLRLADCCMCLYVNLSPLGLSYPNLHAWVSLPETIDGSMQKESLYLGVYF